MKDELQLLMCFVIVYSLGLFPRLQLFLNMNRVPKGTIVIEINV